MLSYSIKERSIDLILLVMLPGILVVLAALAAFGYSTANFSEYVMGTQILSAVIVMILPILRLKRKFRSPYWFLITVTSVAYVHSISLYLGLYQTQDWWDSFSHIYSSMIVTLVVFIALLVIQNYTTRIELGKYPLLMMTFIIGYGFGNSWEIFEWAVDSFYGVEYMTYSVFDTLGDITVSDLIGTVIMTLIGSIALSRKTPDEIVSGMNLGGFMTRTGKKWDRRCGNEEDE